MALPSLLNFDKCNYLISLMINGLPCIGAYLGAARSATSFSPSGIVQRASIVLEVTMTVTLSFAICVSTVFPLANLNSLKNFPSIDTLDSSCAHSTKSCILDPHSMMLHFLLIDNFLMFDLQVSCYLYFICLSNICQQIVFIIKEYVVLNGHFSYYLHKGKYKYLRIY